MRSLYTTFVLLAVIAVGGILLIRNPKIITSRCEERLIPKADLGATCPPPSKLMRVGDSWMCSCRTEEQTMKGIQQR